MPVFSYTALDGKGAHVSGSLSAESLARAMESLERERIYVLEIDASDEAKAAPARRGGWAHIPERERVMMIRRLATLVSADIPIVQCLEAISTQVESAQFGRVLTEIQEEVKQGKSLSAAMAMHPRVFPRLVVAMVHVGETGGFLSPVLDQLADLLERDRAVRGEVLGALIYPARVMSLAVGTVAVLMTTIVPRLSTMFTSMHTTLPLPTRMLLWLSGAVDRVGFGVLIVILASVAGLVLWRRTAGGRASLESFRLRLPLFGTLLRKAAIARFSRALSALLAGGVPLMEALDVVKEVLASPLLTAAVSRMQERVRKGDPLARGMAREPLFPPMVGYMISAGEDSGRLDAMLAKVADIYESETKAAIRAALNLLSPVLILLVAAVVGFIALAMLLPIFQINQMM